MELLWFVSISSSEWTQCSKGWPTQYPQRLEVCLGPVPGGHSSTGGEGTGAGEWNSWVTAEGMNITFCFDLPVGVFPCPWVLGSCHWDQGQADVPQDFLNVFLPFLASCFPGLLCHFLTSSLPLTLSNKLYLVFVMCRALCWATQGSLPLRDWNTFMRDQHKILITIKVIKISQIPNVFYLNPLPQTCKDKWVLF